MHMFCIDGGYWSHPPDHVIVGQIYFCDLLGICVTVRYASYMYMARPGGGSDYLLGRIVVQLVGVWSDVFLSISASFLQNSESAF